MQDIPKSKFSTQDCKKTQSYEAFRDNMSAIFDVSKLNCAAEDFSAIIETHHLGETLLVDCITNAQTFTRSSQMIARDSLDHYIIQLFHHGSTTAQTRSDEPVGKPGNILIIDASCPWEARNSDFHNLSFVVPRQKLAPLLKNENGHHGRTIDASNPFHQFLTNFILELRSSLNRLSLEDASLLALNGMGLLASALNRTTPLSSSSSFQSASATDVNLLRASIKAYLNQNLYDADLDVEKVMERFRISRAHLYRIFQHEGGIANYIRARRLDLAFKMITVSPVKPLSISEVSASLGYRSLASFGRCFKLRYGMTPQEAKMHYQSYERPWPEGHQGFSEWITAL